MSIFTLKKKTYTRYNNMSAGKTLFSLQGVHRSQGWVGQTNLSRSFPRTLFHGDTPRGSGGYMGTYPVANIKTLSVSLDLNDSTVVKPSVVNTMGMIMTKYRWIRRPQPYISADPNLYLNTQESHIERMKRKTLACPDNFIKKDTTIDCIQYNDNLIKEYLKINYRNDDLFKQYFKRNYTSITIDKQDIFKPMSDFVATSQSDYIHSVQSTYNYLDYIVDTPASAPVIPNTDVVIPVEIAHKNWWIDISYDAFSQTGYAYIDLSGFVYYMNNNDYSVFDSPEGYASIGSLEITIYSADTKDVVYFLPDHVISSYNDILIDVFGPFLTGTIYTMYIKQTIDTKSTNIYINTKSEMSKSNFIVGSSSTSTSITVNITPVVGATSYSGKFRTDNTSFVTIPMDGTISPITGLISITFNELNPGEKYYIVIMAYDNFYENSRETDSTIICYTLP